MAVIAQTQVETRRGKLILLLAVGVLTFLLFFFTRAAEQTRDSLVYAYSARTGAELFHPHHLLFSPIIRIFYITLATFCSSCDAVFAGQLHNIFWSVLGVSAFFYLISMLWSTPVAVSSVLLLISLRGFWELTTQTTMYAPSAAILMLIASLLFVPSRRTPGIKPILPISLLFAIAVLYHQSNVLFLLPAVILIHSQWGKNGWKIWMQIAVIAGGIVLLSYLLAFINAGNSFSWPGFLRYCLAYTEEICLGGQCKASPNEWGSFANLSLAGLSLLFQSLIWNYLVIPDQLTGFALLPVGVAYLTLLAWHAFQILRGAEYRSLRLFSLAWMLIYILFFFWWLPSYQHPFVVTLAPVIILTILLLRDILRKRGASTGVPITASMVMALCALVLAARNFQVRIYPLHNSPGDSYFEASQLKSQAPQDCVILTSYRTWNHLRYYFDDTRTVQAKNPLSYFYAGQPLPEQYQNLNQGCLLVSSTFLDPEYSLEDYSYSVVNGYTEPSSWLAYLSWLFELEFEKGKVVSSRDFSILHLEEGSPYFLLNSSRRAVGGLEMFLLSLDSQLADQRKPFESWLTIYSESRLSDPVNELN